MHPGLPRSRFAAMYFPPLTMKLLWATAVMILLPLLLPDALLMQLVLWPWGEASLGVDQYGLPATVGFMPWQLLTHVVINAGAGQLLFVGLTLVFFGARLEAVWGERRYGFFLLTCALGAGLVQLLLLTLGVHYGLLPFTHAAGASGVMFGILFASAFLNPRQQVMLMIPPVPMQMRTLVVVFVGLELAFGVFGTGNGLAHLGFLGGMLAAWLHIQYWRGEPPFKRRRRGPWLVK